MRFDGSRFLENASRYWGPKARRRRAEERVHENRRLRRVAGGAKRLRELKKLKELETRAEVGAAPAPGPVVLNRRGRSMGPSAAESREERLARRARGVGRP